MNIIGPKSLTLYKKDDMKIYLFGEQHIPYNCMNCDNDKPSKRITKFLKDFFEEKNRPIIDFYLEEEVLSKKDYDEKELETTITNIKSRYNPNLPDDCAYDTKPYKDLTILRNFLINCSSLLYKSCEYQNLRVHSVDVRTSKHFPIFRNSGATELIEEMKRTNNNNLRVDIINKLHNTSKYIMSDISYYIERVNKLQNPINLSNIGTKIKANIDIISQTEHRDILNGIMDATITNYRIFSRCNVLQENERYMDVLNTLINKWTDKKNNKFITKRLPDDERDMFNIILSAHKDVLRINNKSFREYLNNLNQLKSSKTLLTYNNILLILNHLKLEFNEMLYNRIRPAIIHITNEYNRLKPDITRIEPYIRQLDVDNKSILAFIYKICYYFNTVSEPSDELIYLFSEIIHKSNLLSSVLGAECVDLYTVARMVRRFDQNIIQSNIIFYGGVAHAKNIGKILGKLSFVMTSEYDTLNAKDRNNNIVDYPKCITIDNLFKTEPESITIGSRS